MIEIVDSSYIVEVNVTAYLHVVTQLEIRGELESLRYALQQCVSSETSFPLNALTMYAYVFRVNKFSMLSK